MHIYICPLMQILGGAALSRAYRPAVEMGATATGDAWAEARWLAGAGEARFGVNKPIGRA
jgi:hypothetical protein